MHPVDEHVADLLRRSGRPVVLAVNKLDEPADAVAQHEFHSLGLGEPVPVSALSGKGSGDLLDRVVAALPDPEDSVNTPVGLRLAVIGKPNVGKSSFVNRMLGEERVLVHDEAGTTRDAIDTFLEFEGERVCLIDTVPACDAARASTTTSSSTVDSAPRRQFSDLKCASSSLTAPPG